MAASEVYRRRVTVRVRVPQDGRKYAQDTDPLHEFNALVEVDLNYILGRVARQAARNRDGRAQMLSGAVKARIAGEGREVTDVR